MSAMSASHVSASRLQASDELSTSIAIQFLSLDKAFCALARACYIAVE